MTVDFANASITLVQKLFEYSAKSEGKRFYFPDEEISLSPIQLLEQVENFAGGFDEWKVPHDSIVLLCGMNSSMIVTAFLATQYGGLIPSIIAPPRRNEINFDERILRLAKVAKPAVILFDESLSEQQLAELKQRFSKIIELSSCRLEYMSCVPKIKVSVKQPASLAFIQFTSGSILEPRGVMISHENLEANLRGMGEVHELRKTEEVFVSWLPLSHDMGLVSMLANSIYLQSDLVLIDPQSFIRHPVKWLRLISQYRGTCSAAPNFAYSLVSRLSDRQLQDVDLSSWNHACNGSEPIDTKVVNNFLTRFQSYGFKPEALHNVYGLAEFTLIATFPPIRPDYHFITASSEILNTTGTFQSASAHETSLNLVSVGKPLPEHQLRIIDIETFEECHAGKTGEIQLRGASVMQGYLNDESPIKDGWLSTGDIGFILENELYVCGRLKNTIKKAGRNIFANDVEGFAISVDGVRHNGIAAFEYKENGEVKLGLAMETRLSENDLRELLASIQEKIKMCLGVAVDDFFVLAIGELPKTTSGKLQRSKLSEQATNGTLKQWKI
jgi:acyl-CoA synthetase (AMP-forming)/AMP-acid ligase II